MEKNKNVRSNQASAKGLVSEARKNNQDASGKQWPRNTRRREFSNNFTATHPKNDRLSNNGNKQQQKTRNNVDKRFRGDRGDGYQRGVSAAATSSGTGLDESDEAGAEFEAELNSVYLPGSKKQNLNHLLNFNYAPRERMDPLTFARTGNNKHSYVKRIKYNKEQFLQANCQFVVKSSGDYKPYTCSPDLLVDWPLIEQIHQLNSTEEPQCPICLYHPVAAKMTRCGHVYCWPCILHYLALSEKKSWRKCPICYEAVHISDLKSTIAKPHRNFGNDDFVTLQLMYRDKDSLRVYCAAGHRENVVAGTDPFSYLTDVEENVVHSKLLLARPMEIMSIIGRERNELKCQLTSEGLECPDSVFVQQALSLLDERESLVKSELEIVGDVDVGCRTTNDALLASSTGAMLNADAAEYVPIGCGAVDSVDDADGASSETASCDDNLLADDIGHLTINDINITQAGSNPNAKRFYFYQAKDGQHLYLHSVNVRMLQTMYGSLEQAPHTIIGRILQKEVCSMSDELRKRLKYLQHLPVSCQFEVVEIAFDRTMVSKEVQAKFQDEIDHRQTVRQRRARAEQKRDKQIDLANERQIGKIIRTSANIDVTSDQQFPIYCGNFDDPPLMQSPLSNTELSVSPETLSASGGPSFAKMLTSPKTTNAALWPSLGPTKEVFSLGVGQISRAPPSVSGAKQSTALDSDEDNDLDFAHRPEVSSECFGSAIEQALMLNNVSARGAKGKKKKNRNTVLFSMGGRTFDGN